MYNDVSGNRLIKASSVIIMTMAAPSIIVIPLVGLLWGYNIYVMFDMIGTSFPAILSACVGILGMSIRGTAKEARMLLVLGIANLIVFPFALGFAVLNLTTIIYDETLQLIMTMIQPFIIMLLFILSLAVNVIFLVGVIKNIKALR